MDTNRDTDTSSFEHDLEAMILDAFARGVTIEGQWEINVPVSTAPDWLITIEKRTSEADPTYEPTFLDD